MLARLHTCTPAHTHRHRAYTAPSPALRLAARAKGRNRKAPGSSSLPKRGTRGLLLPGGLLGALRLLWFGFFFSFLGFELAVSHVHPPLPTAGSSRSNHADHPRRWGRLSPESPGPSLCRAAAAEGFTCLSDPAARSPRGVRPRRFPRSRSVPTSVTLPSSRGAEVRAAATRTLPSPGKDRWRPCGVAGPARAGAPPGQAQARPPRRQGRRRSRFGGGSLCSPLPVSAAAGATRAAPAPPAQPSAFGAGGMVADAGEKASKQVPLALETTDRPRGNSPSTGRAPSRRAGSAELPPLLRRGAEYQLGSARFSPAALPRTSRGRPRKKRPQVPFFTKKEKISRRKKKITNEGFFYFLSFIH